MVARKMKEYCAVMWLGPENEVGLFVKGTSMADVEKTVKERKWKGKLVQIIRMVAPGNKKFNYITNDVNVIHISDFGGNND